MELRQIDRLFLKILLLCSAGIVFTEVMGFEDATSIFFALTFPLTVVLWLRSVRRTMTSMDLLVVLAIFWATTSVLIDLWISGGSVDFGYFKKLIMFSMTLLFFQTAYRVRAGQEIATFVARLVDVLTLVFVVMYFTNRSAVYTINGHVTGYLTFGFTNPNTTGLFLSCICMLQMYRLFTVERWHVKLVHIVFAGVLLWFILETQSRNCLVGVFAYVAVCVWLEFRRQGSLQISKPWAVTVAWFPLLFVGVYMLLIYTPWIQNVFSFLVSAGKGLDSRVRIWKEAVEYILDSPIIGSYYSISNGTGSFQLHNSHLDIAASYGVPVLVIVCVLLTKYLHQKGRYYENKKSFSYIMAFSCAILLGLGEAALFSGGLGIYIFAGLFLLLANTEDAER